MNGIYIHIPFCPSKCHYCNFASGTYSDHALYFKALYTEINNRDRFFDAIDTLYIGGGTPSYVDFQYILHAIEHISHVYNTDNLKEITIEANPDSIDQSFLQCAADSGINRLSIGIQSFNNDILRYLGRIHNSETALNAVLMASKYFNNLSIDIIYAIKDHLQDFSIIPKLPIKHISAYMLQVEEGSYFHGRGLNNDHLDYKEYNNLLKYTQLAGLNRYEVSSFAVNGFESAHNSLYWDRSHQYMGYGLAASSYNGISRSVNIADYRSYIDNPLNHNVEKLCRNDAVLEDIMLRMRTVKGINLNIYNIIDKNIVEEMINEELLYRNGDNIIATDRGFLLLNDIINSLYQSYMDNIRE